MFVQEPITIPKPLEEDGNYTVQVNFDIMGWKDSFFTHAKIVFSFPE